MKGEKTEGAWGNAARLEPMRPAKNLEQEWDCAVIQAVGKVRETAKSRIR
jgi:hypothetical protein